MRFGIWHDFRNPPQWAIPYDRLYRENLDQIAWAEQLGYESVWVSEHHVTDDGYLPSVFPLLAAIAVRTATIRLGSAILLGPFQHPMRFAEDVAVVDQLSGGRLEVGLGLGLPASAEFERARRPIAPSAPGGPRSSCGRRRRGVGRRDGDPAAVPAAGAAFWIGGSSAAAARRAARLGCAFMPDAYVETEVVDLYRSLGGTRVAINPSIYVGDMGRGGAPLPLPVQPLPGVGRRQAARGRR